MTFVAYMFILSIFVLLFILWSKVYFKRLTTILVTSEGNSVVPVIPSPGWFRQHRSSRSCFVNLGSGFVAYQCSSDLDDFYFSDLNVDSNVYIFRSRFGRLFSVDLSDRRLVDILKKFNKGV